ncbi:MAG TPA: 2-oxoacid:ferredoxin oxidoreductase subunit gamma [Tissierellia bacterium]|nr:2-oxoacid:ferredoxin oxidoreductase subunit gamma [Tissierellia bacterium]
MLNERVILAGFGGQGIMLMGQLLTQAGMDENKEVSWLPSYGPEMRGGTANCDVMISEKPIASPIISNDATSAIVMNLPSMVKFVPEVVGGGYVFVNSSLIEEKVERDDVTTYYIPCNEIANDLGNMKIANMVMLGAYVEVTKSLDPESVLNALEKKLGMTKASLMGINREAFAKGAEAAREQI